MSNPQQQNNKPSGRGAGNKQNGPSPYKRKKTNERVPPVKKTNEELDMESFLEESLQPSSLNAIQGSSSDDESHMIQEEQSGDQIDKIDYLNSNGNFEYETKKQIEDQKQFLQNIPKSDKMLLHVYTRNIEITDEVMEYLSAMSKLRNAKIDISVINMTAALYSYPPMVNVDSNDFLDTYSENLDYDPMAFDKPSPRDRAFKFLPGNFLSLLAFYRSRQWSASMERKGDFYEIELETGGEKHTSTFIIKNGFVFLEKTRSSIFQGADFTFPYRNHPSYLSTDVYFSKLPVLPMVNAAFFSTAEWNELFNPFNDHANNFGIAPLSNAVYRFYNSFRASLRRQFKDISIDKLTDMGGLTKTLVGRMDNAKYKPIDTFADFKRNLPTKFQDGLQKAFDNMDDLSSDEKDYKKHTDRMIRLLAPYSYLNNFLSLLFRKVPVAALIKSRTGKATLNEAIYAFGRMRATVSRLNTHVSAIPGSEPIAIYTGNQSAFRKAKNTQLLDEIDAAAGDNKVIHIAPANVFQDRSFEGRERVYLFSKKRDHASRRYINSTQTLNKIALELLQLAEQVESGSELPVHFWLATQNGTFSHADIHIFFNELLFDDPPALALMKFRFFFHGTPESFGIGSNFIVPYTPKTNARISSRNARCDKGQNRNGIVTLEYKFNIVENELEKTFKFITTGSGDPRTTQIAFKSLMIYIETFKEYLSAAYFEMSRHHTPEFVDYAMALVPFLPGPKAGEILKDDDDQARAMMDDYLLQDDMIDIDNIINLEDDNKMDA